VKNSSPDLNPQMHFYLKSSRTTSLPVDSPTPSGSGEQYLPPDQQSGSVVTLNPVDLQ